MSGVSHLKEPSQGVMCIARESNGSVGALPFNALASRPTSRRNVGNDVARARGGEASSECGGRRTGRGSGLNARPALSAALLAICVVCTDWVAGASPRMQSMPLRPLSAGAYSPWILPHPCFAIRNLRLRGGGTHDGRKKKLKKAKAMDDARKKKEAKEEQARQREIRAKAAERRLARDARRAERDAEQAPAAEMLAATVRRLDWEEEQRREEERKRNMSDEEREASAQLKRTVIASLRQGEDAMRQECGLPPLSMGRHPCELQDELIEDMIDKCWTYVGNSTSRADWGKGKVRPAAVGGKAGVGGSGDGEEEKLEKTAKRVNKGTAYEQESSEEEGHVAKKRKALRDAQIAKDRTSNFFVDQEEQDDNPSDDAHAMDIKLSELRRKETKGLSGRRKALPDMDDTYGLGADAAEDLSEGDELRKLIDRGAQDNVMLGSEAEEGDSGKGVGDMLAFGGSESEDEDGGGQRGGKSRAQRRKEGERETMYENLEVEMRL